MYALYTLLHIFLTKFPEKKHGTSFIIRLQVSRPGPPSTSILPLVFPQRLQPTTVAATTEVTFFTQFMELIEETEERGLDTDPFRMCIADVSRELDCGAFAQGERHFD